MKHQHTPTQARPASWEHLVTPLSTSPRVHGRWENIPHGLLLLLLFKPCCRALHTTRPQLAARALLGQQLRAERQPLVQPKDIPSPSCSGTPTAEIGSSDFSNGVRGHVTHRQRLLHRWHAPEAVFMGKHADPERLPEIRAQGQHLVKSWMESRLIPTPVTTLEKLL